MGIMTDHDVKQYGDHLKGKKIAVIVTGGVAAYKAPSVIRAIRMYGADVVTFQTENSKRFVTTDTLKWASNNPIVTELTDRSEHLSHEGKEYDGVLIFPATSNFMAKMANGLADDAPSTLIVSALGRQIPIAYCPAMHGSMADSIGTQTSIAKLERFGLSRIEPLIKDGKWNVNDTKTTVANFVRTMCSHGKPDNYSKSVLVTAGPTPTMIDNVRMIVNKFSGKLGIEIANELYLRGHNVYLLQSYTGIRPPKYIPHHLFKDYNEYKESVMNHRLVDYAILSAAVADYQPTVTAKGKLPSGGKIKSIELEATEKVVDLFISEFSHPKVISFKYEENEENPLDKLKEIAGKRLGQGHHMVIGNDLHLNTDEQICYFFDRIDDCIPGFPIMGVRGKLNIARHLVNYIND